MTAAVLGSLTARVASGEIVLPEAIGPHMHIPVRAGDYCSLPLAETQNGADWSDIGPCFKRPMICGDAFLGSCSRLAQASAPQSFCPAFDSRRSHFCREGQTEASTGVGSGGECAVAEREGRHHCVSRPCSPLAGNRYVGDQGWA
jgi:hypothetical protein